MRKRVKKTVIYLIMTALVMPTWLITGMTNAAKVKAAPLEAATNVVISEVQVSGDSVNDEFIELYNPTNHQIDLSGWNLKKKTASGNESALKTLEGTVDAYSYFLVSNQDYVRSNEADLTYSNPAVLANDNAILLYDESTLIDALGLGTSVFGEKNSIANPPANKSVERLFDNNIGNFIDTDDNSADFYLQDNPNPQGSSSMSLMADIEKNTAITVTPSELINKEGTAEFSVTVNYPDNISQVNPEYKTDAMIVSSKEIPAGTRLDLTYNGTDLGYYTFDSNTSNMWLSQIISRINITLPVRTSFKDETDCTWGFKLSGLTEGEYNINFATVIAKNFDNADDYGWIYEPLTAKIVIDNTVTAPSGVTAVKNNSDVNITWNQPDDISGIVSYNIYRSDDNFTAKINSTNVTSNSFTDQNLIDGKYSYKIQAIDKAQNVSNLSDASNEVTIDTRVLTSPEISISNYTKDTDQYVRVEWKGIGLGVEKYEVYVDGITSSENTITVTADDLQVSYQKDVKVLSEGDHKVYVKAIKGSDYVLSGTKTISIKSVVAPVVEETPAPVVSAAPSKVKAEEPKPVEDKIETPSDDNGIIKGDENKDEEDKINWTPWIVLFVLIILAGAATGGYFYWFNGEEEVKAVVKEPKKEEKPIAPVQKKKVTNKKKQKRW